MRVGPDSPKFTRYIRIHARGVTIARKDKTPRFYSRPSASSLFRVMDLMYQPGRYYKGNYDGTETVFFK